MFSKLLPQAQSISYFWRKFSFVLLFLLSVLALLGLIVAGYDTLAPIYGDNIRRAIMGASGLLFGLFMTWQCILGVRPMSSAWVKDFFRVNGWHKWLGIGTLTLLILQSCGGSICLFSRAIMSVDAWFLFSIWNLD